MRLSYKNVAAHLVFAATISACGPSTRTAVRWDAKPFDKNEFKQAKEGLAIDLTLMSELPPELITSVPVCDTNGNVYRDANGQQESRQIGLLSWERGQSFARVTITNNNESIVRFNLAAVRLTDPAGNQYEPQSKDDVIGLGEAAVRCAPSALTGKIRMLKLYDRNLEIMPRSTWKGYVVFAVPTDAMLQAGTWKYSFYELPVAMNEAGAVTRKTNFEFRLVSRKFVDTYRRESLLAKEVLTGSTEAQ